jgi:hypothetical protein
MFQAQSHTRESHIMHQCLEVSIGSHPMEETNIDKETAIAVVVDPLHTYIHTYISHVGCWIEPHELHPRASGSM